VRDLSPDLPARATSTAEPDVLCYRGHPRLRNIIDKPVEIETMLSAGNQDASSAECGVVVKGRLDSTLSGSKWSSSGAQRLGLGYSSLSRVMGSERMRRPLAW
jgi:hypothetical protein